MVTSNAHKVRTTIKIKDIFVKVQHILNVPTKTYIYGEYAQSGNLTVINTDQCYDKKIIKEIISITTQFNLILNVDKLYLN
jgi:hypothetical protein